MKQARSTNNKQNKQGSSNKTKPDIRDDMDSRHTKDLHSKRENGNLKTPPKKK